MVQSSDNYMGPHGKTMKIGLNDERKFNGKQPFEGRKMPFIGIEWTIIYKKQLNVYKNTL